MIYIQLFLAFFQIGAFSFGGGYAAMPLIKSQVVDHYGWLTTSDFSDLITISQMTPGPIAINSATFVGNQIGGIPGSLAATLGCLLPSCVFVTLLAWLYTKYQKLSLMQGILETLRPTVVSMIATAGIGILLPAIYHAGNLKLRPILYFIGAFILLKKKKMDPILVMVICGILEVFVQILVPGLT